MNKLVIGLTGKIGSGKTIIADHLSKKYSASKYQFSKILIDILNRVYLPTTRENLQKLGISLRKELGKEVIVNALENDIKKNSSQMIVIDGIRYMNEVDMLRKFKNNNLLICIEAPAELRYERCVKRREKEGEKNITFEEFLNAEKKETEQEIDNIAKIADYKIMNDENKGDLFKKVDEIIKEKIMYNKKKNKKKDEDNIEEENEGTDLWEEGTFFQTMNSEEAKKKEDENLP